MKVKIILEDTFDNEHKIETLYESDDDYFIIEVFRMIIFDLKLLEKIKYD